ncbi:MAG: hypothetical protein AABX28_01175 [Nanoarchaeota archaeon]
MQKENLFSDEDKKIISLLEFTRELIRNSGGEIFELKEILDKRHEEEEKKKEESKQLTEITEDSREFDNLSNWKEKNIEEEKGGKILKEPFVKKIFARISAPLRRNSPGKAPPVLRIPVQKLPPRFEYLKPTPTAKEIELGKLNPLIRDPLVRGIECNGQNTAIVVTGSMGMKNTNIVFDESEINEIIEKFSQATKIPYGDGVFHVVFGKLIFLAIVSPEIGSKFVIKKMA